MAFDQSNLRHKFETVTNSQENIQTLSLWLIHHKNHHKKIIETWQSVISKCESLPLFFPDYRKSDMHSL